MNIVQAGTPLLGMSISILVPKEANITFQAQLRMRCKVLQSA